MGEATTRFRPAEALRERLWWLAPSIAGLFLRLDRLREQVLFGDELHGLRRAFRETVPELLTRIDPQTDACPPLAALIRALWLAQGSISVPTMRLPSLLAGMALVVAVPLWLAGRDANGTPRASRGTAAIAAWLVALSPTLVAYSRIVRPYAIVAALAFGAVVAFERFRERPRAGSATAFAVCGALALWFFPGVAPVLAALFVFGLVERVRARRGASLASLANLAFSLASATALWLLPAYRGYAELLGGKVGGRGIPFAALEASGELFAGVRGRVALVVFAALAILGAVHWARRDRPRALLFAMLLVAQAAALGFASPYGAGNPVVWNRYQLVTTVFALVFVAEGIHDLAIRVGALGASAANRTARIAIPVLAVAALVAAGPLPDRARRWSSFLHSEEFLGFYAGRSHWRAGAEVPETYRKITAVGRESRNRAPVLEFDGLPTWGPIDLLAVAQATHRLPVQVAANEPGLFVPGVDLTPLVGPRPKEYLAGKARWLVVHLDVEAERRRIERPEVMGLGELSDALVAEAVRRARSLAEELRGAWGNPDLSDPLVVAWDLERLRAVGDSPREERAVGRRHRRRRGRAPRSAGQGAEAASAESGSQRWIAASASRLSESLPSRRKQPLT